MIGALVGRYRATDALIVFSEYDGVQAPPTLFDRSLFAELAGPEGKGCGKTMRRRHPGRETVVAWPSAALADLDVPEDYARVKAELG
jgi:CTP:molybdopterin cytidylyltransferase MocA